MTLLFLYKVEMRYALQLRNLSNELQCGSVTQKSRLGQAVQEEKIFFDFVNLFLSIYFNIFFPWKRMWPFIWTNLNPLYLMMLCDKFYCKWTSGSGEEIKIVKSLQTDDGWQAIRKAQLMKGINRSTKRNQNKHLSGEIIMD